MTGKRIIVSPRPEQGNEQATYVIPSKPPLGTQPQGPPPAPPSPAPTGPSKGK